jgi:hypothetical protein
MRDSLPTNPEDIGQPSHSPNKGSSLADIHLILRKDETVPLPNTMDQENASTINRVLFHLQAPAHITIMNPRRNGKGAITAITRQNATAEMALHYCDNIITAVSTVDKRVVDVEDNETCERLKIHPVPPLRYMGKGMEGLQNIRQEFKPDIKGITIPSEVWQLENPHTIRERRQNGEIATSSVVFVAKGSKAA